MGLFWLTSGLVLVRRAHPVLDRGAENAMGKRTSVLLGTIGVLAGLLVLTRTLSFQVVPEVLVFELLGAVILLTGILHLIGQFRIDRISKLGRTTRHKILAIFEIVLGVLLISSPLERSPIVYWVATVWALIAGIAIIGDALYARSQEREETQPDAV